MTANTPAGYELLETGRDVTSYLRDSGLLPLVAGEESLVTVVEVTAGNMNRVFIARGPAGSVAIKQAPPWVQVAGPGWPIDPGRIASEARTYERLAARVPESIPTIVHFDELRHILVMEDLSDLAVVRDELVRELQHVPLGKSVGEATADAGAPSSARPVPAYDWADVGDVVGRFIGELSMSTSRGVLGDVAFELLVESAANPELCGLTVDVVLDEPYRAHEHNHWHPALDSRVRDLYADVEARRAVALVRSRFKMAKQGLVHGDLHTGSVMVGYRGGSQVTKIFDPEFSFVGPIGLDLGLFWANMEIAAIAAGAVGDHAAAAARLEAVTRSRAAFAAVWRGDSLLPVIEREARGFAGVEMMRRAVGYSHAADIESLSPAQADAASVELFDTALEHLRSVLSPSHPPASTTAPHSPFTEHEGPSRVTDTIPTSTPLSVRARVLVLDLEGTTSAAGFILGDLYDYARPRLAAWLDDHASDPAIAAARAQVIQDARLPADATTCEVVAVLHQWMADDVKATPLKTIQGQIWAEGFARDEISSHFFGDVIPKLRSWHDEGVRLAVFSSGSVASQVPWFRHSPDGDLTGLITDYFDTVNAGPKKVASSYDTIANALGAAGPELLFFTDNPGEVAAAAEAGWQVVAFAREGEPFFESDFGGASVVASFDDVEVSAL
ncbi:acireductone synthase [Subtercola frigoramans]|uniref:2,3-diketo-5-methylthio-1-phosphopentane phosphatase n=1 Tax=Subtercola frigoramans TaxID=120298 RepID=A0ABS2L2P8_9MICO|nr:acireductone synthase [Subtercola frigoramans]MBM7471368.1 2,3-diketo-5-methylthio-1-phosphopentane phosphatase [Subtercola frigoramans]